MRALAVVLVFAFTGCLFATNQGTDCLGDFLELRLDPRTGACVQFGDADGCYFCTGPSHGCIVSSADQVSKLDYPDCGGTCFSAAEPACLDLAGCHAAYASGSFVACWNTAPSGPVSNGVCAGLDAHECSRHDNCSTWYLPGADPGSMAFDHCEDGVHPT